jgi:hypothetical protein
MEGTTDPYRIGPILIVRPPFEHEMGARCKVHPQNALDVKDINPLLLKRLAPGHVGRLRFEVFFEEH